MFSASVVRRVSSTRVNFGTATAANTPSTMTTTNSSVNVKALVSASRV